MHPQDRKLLPEAEADALQSYERHNDGDLLVFGLHSMDAGAKRLGPKITVRIENVEHHMGEEEDEWFPKVREGLGRKQLCEIGDRMVEMKKTAPRSPAAPSAMKKALDAVKTAF